MNTKIILTTFSRKGLFLGFLPDTTKNIFYYDQESNRIKKASHFCFDKGFNDLPLHEQPPNVIHLCNAAKGDAFPIDPPEYSTSEDFDFFNTPFASTKTYKIYITCEDTTFGLHIEADETSNRAFIDKISTKRSLSVVKHFKTHKKASKNLKGYYVVAINDRPCFEKDDVIDRLCALSNDNAVNFELTVAFDQRLLAHERWRNLEELDLYTPHNLPHPDAPDDEDYSPDLTIEDIRHIAALHSSRFKAEKHARDTAYNFDEDDISISSDDSMASLDPDDPDAIFSPSYLSLEAVTLAINAIRSSHTTEDEQAIGKFTRRKLQQLDTWPDWKHGEMSQLDKMAKVGMYGKPCKAPRKAIVLRPHWQYHLKRTGDRRSRNCCDGSKRAAPALHAVTSTYSSCVNQPVQRLFFALAAINDHKVYGGDIKDAFAHSPGPDVPTFVRIDNQYSEWWSQRHKTNINRSHVLPVLRCLQGHPESGKIYERHINQILGSKELNFRATVHDRCIYQTTYKGQQILLLKQVDDLAIATNDESLAKEIYNIIGKKLQLPGESDLPFTYLGLINDYNGVDVDQRKEYIEVNACSYIK